MKIHIINPYACIGELHNECVKEILADFLKKSFEKEGKAINFHATSYTSKEMYATIVKHLLEFNSNAPVPFKVEITNRPVAVATNNDITIICKKEDLHIKAEVANAINHHILNHGKFDLEKLAIDDKIKFFCQKLLSIDYDKDEEIVQAQIQDIVTDIVKIIAPAPEKQVALISAAIAEQSHSAMKTAEKDISSNKTGFWGKFYALFTDPPKKPLATIKKIVVEDTKGAMEGGFTKYLEGAIGDIASGALVSAIVGSSSECINEAVEYYHENKK
jgi:hypothetical protein